MWHAHHFSWSISKFDPARFNDKRKRSYGSLPRSIIRKFTVGQGRQTKTRIAIAYATFLIAKNLASYSDK